MNLRLRDRIAEWLLEALEREETEAPLRALSSFVAGADDEGKARLSAGTASQLLEADDLFEPIEGGARLRAEIAAELPQLRERTGRFLRALGACRKRPGPAPAGLDPLARAGEPPNPGELSWLLEAARALFDEGLYFEVHELLEPAWGRSAEDLRTFLQGLIQVAVGFHHHGNGNLRGACSLLREGNAKLRATDPEEARLGAAGFLDAVDAVTLEVARQLERGRPGPLKIPRLGPAA